MRSTIVGVGEIGKAVHKVIGEAYLIDINLPEVKITQTDIMHICLPYTEEFSETVKAYMTKYTPKHVIVYSTVPIGTCKKISPMIVHSPVEGKHPHLADSMLKMTRWIGANDFDEATFFVSYFEKQGIPTYLVDSTDYTEALKLLSTTEYGLNIEFARYKKHIADSIGMDFQLTKDWNADYNNLYQDLGLAQFQKFILDAPEGKKGGHCIVPNAKILDEQYPSEFTKIVGEM